jgi:membrane protease YdiL (CAAX protease family)
MQLMKTHSLVFVFLLCCIFYPVSADERLSSSLNAKYFGATETQLKTDGFAEVEFKNRLPTETHLIRDRVWFSTNGNFRIESCDNMLYCEFCEYMVRNGRHFFRTFSTPESHTEGRWLVTPEEWMPNLLRTYLLRNITILDARFVDRKQVLGLSAEHWTGRPPGKFGTGTVDVWISKDSQIPIVLKVETISKNRHSIWQIRNLNTSKNLPSYIFTPQTHPSASLLALIKMPYKPPLFLFTWYILVLCCYAGIAVPLTRKDWKRRKKLAVVIISGLCLLSLFLIPTGFEVFAMQFSDIWVPVCIMILTLICIGLIWRTVGSPGVDIFRGTRWIIVVYAILAAVLGLFWSKGYENYTVASIGLSRCPLPFMPAILSAVTLLAISWAAIEELIFRGYIFSAICQKKEPVFIAIILQALIFGATHIPKYINACGFSIHVIVQTTIIVIWGIIFGLLRCRHKNLAAPFLVHAAFNIASIYVSYASIFGILHALG